MTSAEIDALAQRWLESLLEAAEDHRAIDGPFADYALEGVDVEMSDMFETADECLTTCDYRPIAATVDEIVASAGLPPLDHTSDTFRRLCRRILRARIAFLRIEQDRWEGRYPEDIHRGRMSPAATAPAIPPVLAATHRKPFTDVVEAYCTENPRSARTTAQVAKEYQRFAAGLPKGDKTPIGEILKADCRRYKESLLQTRGLTLSTVSKHLSILSGVFRWAEGQGFIPDGTNPVRGLAPNKRHVKKAEKKRRLFTDAELLTVFSSPEFLAQREARPERYWLILLCLFQFCRREEAGQLALKDIGEEDGIPLMHITDTGPHQSLKNAGSRRRMPLHPVIVALGFLHYVDRMRQAGQTRLFPQLRLGPNGYADPVGKFFSRLVTKQGLTDPALVLHSLRHGGISKLHAAGATHHIVEVLAGHTTGTVHEQVYSHRDKLPMRLLLNELTKLRYAAVEKLLRG